MGSAKYCTSIYLYSGYWQCCITNEDILKTTFFMRYSLCEWIAMPMGLNNALAMFMHTMNNLFSDILNFGMAALLDDILVYSRMV